VVFVRDTGACEGCLLVRIKALEPRIDITTSELL
jgi:hypothetical protein